MPQPRSQLVTVRRPRAKSSPVQSCTNRACWRASSVPAKAVIQTTSDTGSHCDSIHGSPSHDSVAISNHSMRGEPPHLKSPPASGTPNEVPDFWESAVSIDITNNSDCDVVLKPAFFKYGPGLKRAPNVQAIGNPADERFPFSFRGRSGI